MENAIIGVLLVFSISLNIYYAAMLIPLLKSDKNFYRSKCVLDRKFANDLLKHLTECDKKFNNAKQEIKDLQKVILDFDPGFEFGLSN